MKTVFISGASTGIGAATAVAFAKQHFQVIATMRNPQKADALRQAATQENLSIEMLTMDVTDAQSVDSAVSHVIDKYGRIDVVLNNAGAGYLGTMEQTSLIEAQRIMDVNFFGVWRLMQAVLPTMRQQQSGHIIAVSSVGGVVGQPFNEAYCAAKFAVEGLYESFAPIARRLGINLSLVEPGAVNSEFVQSTLDASAELPSGLEKDYGQLYSSYIDATKSVFSSIAQAPEEVADLIVKIAQQTQPDFRNQTSAMAKKMVTAKLNDFTGNNTVEMAGLRL